MKAVMLSLRPQWCEKIFNGSKTIEVRKSRPSIPTPFTVYVYMTKPKPYLSTIIREGDNIYGDIYHGKTLFIKSDRHYYNRDYQTMEQRVIGSFLCDRIVDIQINGDDYGNYWHEWDDDCDIEAMCLSYEELETYLGKSVGYGWHITEPKLFDKPRALGEFSKFGYEYLGGCCVNYKCPNCIDNGWMQPPECKMDGCFLTRPPQSWCYVEVENDT